MRTLIVLSLALGLGACESQEEKDARFIKACNKSFSNEQCGFLLVMQKNNEDATDSANAAAGLAIGLSVGAKR